MPLSRLIYISENQIDTSRESMVAQLNAILSTSNRNNRAKNITGALIFDQMWFLQALEGERRSIWSEFERIKEDERHSNVVLIEMLEVGTRTFGNWWMGLATRTEQTEHHFAPYVRNGCFRADAMSAVEVMDMMRGFAELGAHRGVVSRVA